MISGEIDFRAIGNKLREVRIEKGLTQEYVANHANVNVSHISNIENNRVKISLQTLVAVCNALEITVDYVLSNEYISGENAMDNEVLKEFHACSPQMKEKVIGIIQILKK